MKRILRSAVSLLLCAAVALGGTACGRSKLPTTITIWTYYNGDQLECFNQLVEQFNSTVGKEKNIRVESSSQGSVNGNEKIEQAVCQLQQEPTQEQLAHTLTVIRRRMRENGQVVVAVEPNPASEQMQLRALRTADGASWWYAFTSFEEEMKGAEAVQSTFLVELEKLLDAALQVPEIQGIILNPWNRTIQLDKPLLRIIKG